MKTKKLNRIGWHEFIRTYTPLKLARVLGVDKSLPYMWLDGKRPKVENAQKAVAVAKEAGYELKLEDVLGGAK